MSGVEKGKQELLGRLKETRGEIEDALLVRLPAVPAADALDSEYRTGLHAALQSLLELWLSSLEQKEATVALPPATLAQIGLVARRGVGLQVVLRRTAVGYALLGDRLLAAATVMGSERAVLDVLLSRHTHLLEPLVSGVAQAFEEARALSLNSDAHTLAESVRRVLTGDAVMLVGTSYALAGWHTGLLATGPRAERNLRDLVQRSRFDGLVIAHSPQSAWAWLGGEHPLPSIEVQRLASVMTPGEVFIVVGEPARNVEGFRRTHREAQAALGVWMKQPQPLLRYRDVALLAHALADETLRESLLDLYIAPLRRRHPREKVLRETITVFLRAGQSVKATAAELQADRRTIRARLASIEELLGVSISERQAELELALRIDELDTSSTDSSAETRIAASDPGEAL